MNQLHLTLIISLLALAYACSSPRVTNPAAPTAAASAHEPASAQQTSPPAPADSNAETTGAAGLNLPVVITPDFDDEYSRTVKQLEAGHTDIDYVAFRNSFIASEQYRVAAATSTEVSELKKSMYAQMDTRNYPEIIRITKAILSIDYTDMMAHKILRQTYEYTDDRTNGRKYKSIQFGLLKSIVDNGDGKSCPTAWPVVQIAEEYFILQMLGANLLRQSIDNTGGLCDKMEVEMKGENRIYYFEISTILEKRRESLGE